MERRSGVMIRKIFIALALLIGTLMSLEDQVSAALITNEPSGSWTSMSMTGAPPFQFGITAVSVGNKLIVLGLKDDTSFENTGAIYDPDSDSWAQMSMTGAPSFQLMDSAVSVGAKLIVLGLKDDTSFENTGAIYEFVTKIGPKAMPWIPLLLLGD